MAKETKAAEEKAAAPAQNAEPPKAQHRPASMEESALDPARSPDPRLAMKLGEMDAEVRKVCAEWSAAGRAIDDAVFGEARRRVLARRK